MEEIRLWIVPLPPWLFMGDLPGVHVGGERVRRLVHRPRIFKPTQNPPQATPCMATPRLYIGIEDAVSCLHFH